MAERSKPPNPMQQLVIFCRRIPDQKNINRAPLDLKVNSICKRNAKRRRKFARSSKRMNKSRTSKKSKSNLTDSTAQNGTNVDLISKRNIVSTSVWSNLVNSDSSLIKTNNDTAGKFLDDRKTNSVKQALIPVRDPVTNEIKKILLPVEDADTCGLNVIKNILVPVCDKSGLISYDVKKVVVPIKQKSNFHQTSKEDDKLIIIGNIMQPMGSVQKENTSTIENQTKRLENSEKSVAQVSLNESRVQCTEDQSGMEKDKGEKEDQIEHEKEGQDETESLKLPGPEIQNEEMDQILENLKTICPVCQRMFKNEIMLQRHIRRFHEKIHPCDKCNKWYPSKLLLQEHKISHEDDSYLQCSMCHLKYKRKIGLKYHHIRVHSNVEPKFMCDYCGKRFKLKIDLGGHIEKTHLNVSHICKICGKVVKNITHHEWQHDRVAKRIVYKYSCNLCRKKFTTRNNLDNHLLMHKDGFKCTLCDEVFSSPYSLGSHKSTKHRRGATCTICERSFTSTSNFYQHVLTHAGIRPYKCDICGEDFTQRSSVLRHRKTHPGPLPPFTETTSIADIAKNILQKLSNV